jgi:hypothetical protein
MIPVLYIIPFLYMALALGKLFRWPASSPWWAAPRRWPGPSSRTTSGTRNPVAIGLHFPLPVGKKTKTEKLSSHFSYLWMWNNSISRWNTAKALIVMQLYFKFLLDSKTFIMCILKAVKETFIACCIKYAVNSFSLEQLFGPLVFKF